MNKKDWCVLTSVLLLFCVCDQLSKWIALKLLSSKAVMLGPIGFAAYQQPLLLGNVNVLQYMTATSSAVFGILFLFLFFVLNLIWTDKLFKLRISLALLTAGFLCDSIDKIFSKGTVDWIVIFNNYISLNDIYILVGLILTIFFFVKNYSAIFYKHSLRKKMIIEKDQYTFCAYIVLSYLILITGFGMFFITTFTIISDNIVTTSNDQTNLIFSFLLPFILLSICFLLIMSIFTIYLSNKVYGPVYAFKKYIKDVLLSGEENRSLNLRKGDHFKDLSDLATQLETKYKKDETK